MKIILVRHGDAKNQDGIFHGVTNDPLTADGEDEALDVAERLKKYKPSIIYASPVRRAKETAELIGHTLNIPVRVAPELKPLDLGKFVGRDIDQDLENLKYYLANPSEKIPGGQSVKDWASKYLPFFRKLFDAKSDQSIAFVTHGRNFILTKANLKSGGTKFDSKVLTSETHSAEHGGMAVATPPNKFELLDAKQVKPGQS